MNARDKENSNLNATFNFSCDRRAVSGADNYAAVITNEREDNFHVTTLKIERIEIIFCVNEYSRDSSFFFFFLLPSTSFA